eukprot:4241067-Amphidinium_carterae.1
MPKNKGDASTLSFGAAGSSMGQGAAEKRRKLAAKKQLEFGGFRTCALCKVSSKDMGHIDIQVFSSRK